MEAFKALKDYLRAHFHVHDERTDLYAYFIEREHDLLREGGRFGMIVSNKFLRANYGQKVRERISRVASVQRILDLAGLPVFRGATVRTIVLITVKGQTGAGALYSPPPPKDAFLPLEGNTRTLAEVCDTLAYPLTPDDLSSTGWRLTGRGSASLLERLQTHGRPLSKVIDGRICRGIVSGLTDAFVITADSRRHILRAIPRAREIIRPFVQGRNIRRYYLERTENYLIYTHHGIDMTPYPAVLEHLRPFRKRLEKRATKQEWYELQQPQLAYKELLEQPKIVFPDIATECRFTIDRLGHFGANTVYFLPTDDFYLLGVLNSRLANFYFAQTCAGLEGPGQKYLRFFGQYLENFPVPTIDRAHSRLAALVQQMLDLHKSLAAAKTAHEKTALQRQIDATDRQIDQLVYELYGLTDDEIRIVEEATRP